MSYAIARTEDNTNPPLTITPEPWTVQAVCAQIGGDLWFPDRGQPTKPAKTICKTCPVIEECLDYAVRTKQREGVWGGKAGRQIRKARTGK